MNIYFINNLQVTTFCCGLKITSIYLVATPDPANLTVHCRSRLNHCLHSLNTFLLFIDIILQTFITLYEPCTLCFFFICGKYQSTRLNNDQACLDKLYKSMVCLLVSLRSTTCPAVFIITVYLLRGLSLN